jgi:hypothetical protein
VRARRKCAIALCTCGALDSAARRRSTAALYGTGNPRVSSRDAVLERPPLDEANAERVSRYLVLCWIGVAFDPGASRSTWWAVAIFLLAVPSGIATLTLLWQMVEVWRWRCLWLLVAWAWPPLGVLVTSLLPVVFLSFVTYRVVRFRQQAQARVAQ